MTYEVVVALLAVSVFLNLVLGFLVVEYFRVRMVLESAIEREREQLKKERWAKQEREWAREQKEREKS